MSQTSRWHTRRASGDIGHLALHDDESPSAGRNEMLGQGGEGALRFREDCAFLLPPSAVDPAEQFPHI